MAVGLTNASSAQGGSTGNQYAIGVMTYPDAGGYVAVNLGFTPSYVIGFRSPAGYYDFHMYVNHDGTMLEDMAYFFSSKFITFALTPEYTVNDPEGNIVIQTTDSGFKYDSDSLFDSGLFVDAVYVYIAFR